MRASAQSGHSLLRAALPTRQQLASQKVQKLGRPGPDESDALECNFWTRVQILTLRAPAEAGWWLQTQPLCCRNSVGFLSNFRSNFCCPKRLNGPSKHAAEIRQKTDRQLACSLSDFCRIPVGLS